MAKKKPVTRTSAKQKFADYKTRALAFINLTKYPSNQSAFSVTGYNVTAGVKKPNALSAPELIAIVGTAQKLGKIVQVTISGIADGGQLDFRFVDSFPSIPNDLL